MLKHKWMHALVVLTVGVAPLLAGCSSSGYVETELETPELKVPYTPIKIPPTNTKIISEWGRPDIAEIISPDLAGYCLQLDWYGGNAQLLSSQEVEFGEPCAAPPDALFFMWRVVPCGSTGGKSRSRTGIPHRDAEFRSDWVAPNGVIAVDTLPTKPRHELFTASLVDDPQGCEEATWPLFRHIVAAFDAAGGQGPLMTMPACPSDMYVRHHVLELVSGPSGTPEVVLTLVTPGTQLESFGVNLNGQLNTLENLPGIGIGGAALSNSVFVLPWERSTITVSNGWLIVQVPLPSAGLNFDLSAQTIDTATVHYRTDAAPDSEFTIRVENVPPATPRESD